MSNFLAALKVKASEVQSTIPQPMTPKNVAPIVPASNDQSVYAFARALDRVDIIAARNRLDLYFNCIPSLQLRVAMKAHGFRYRSDPIPAWYHEDTIANRAFLNAAFNLDIDTTSDLSPVPPPPPLVINVAPIAPIVDQRSEVPENYRKYLQQTSELLAELGIEFADLALVAVDCLHKQTFSNKS